MKKKKTKTVEYTMKHLSPLSKVSTWKIIAQLRHRRHYNEVNAGKLKTFIHSKKKKKEVLHFLDLCSGRQRHNIIYFNAMAGVHGINVMTFSTFHIFVVHHEIMKRGSSSSSTQKKPKKGKKCWFSCVERERR